MCWERGGDCHVSHDYPFMMCAYIRSKVLRCNVHITVQSYSRQHPSVSFPCLSVYSEVGMKIYPMNKVKLFKLTEM